METKHVHRQPVLLQQKAWVFNRVSEIRPRYSICAIVKPFFLDFDKAVDKVKHVSVSQISW